MFKLVIFSVIAIALFYQPLGAEASGRDAAKKAFHKLMEAIDKALTGAQNALNKSLDTVKAKATQLEGKANAKLDKTLAPLRKTLDDLLAKAKSKGFDVAKCQSFVDDFSKIPNTMVYNLIDCVNHQITKAQNLINDALNNAKQIQQNLNTIDSEIDKCGGKVWQKAKCYSKIIVKIAKATKEAPRHIIEDVAKTTALIFNILPVLETCFLNQVRKAGVDAAKDIAKFAICAAV